MGAGDRLWMADGSLYDPKTGTSTYFTKEHDIMSDESLTEAEKEARRSFGLEVQPDPIPNDRPSSHDRVIELFRKRKDFGLEKYGTPLQAGNGRDHIADVLDELADAMVYLQTQKDELALAKHEAWEAGYYAGQQNERHGTLAPNPYPHPFEEDR